MLPAEELSSRLFIFDGMELIEQEDTTKDLGALLSQEGISPRGKNWNSPSSSHIGDYSVDLRSFISTTKRVDSTESSGY